MVIIPSVGRVVWFHPDPKSAESGFAPAPTLAAIIAHVWSDRMVNLTVFDADGVPHSRTSVELRQPGDPVPAGMHCEWMPYQQGQAAKTEQAEAALREASKLVPISGVSH